MTTTQLSSGTSYTLEQRIAQGGMGTVYRGTLRSPAGHRTVAIKRLLATQQVTAEATSRLTTEARLVFQLNHANICQVLDLGADGNEIYVVMEYVHGLDLGRLLRRLRQCDGPLELAQVLYVGREVARALDYTHRRKAEGGGLLGLVHGDITPGNILLSIEGEVKLSDFGIARRGASRHAQVRGGTPGFMAPEAEGATIDHRADLYSLGATLWCALCGRIPTEGIDVRAIEQRTDVSPELQTLLSRMLAVDPGDRPMSAAAVEIALATELARRHPGFTPARLGALVARAIEGDRGDPSPAIASLPTLVSMFDEGSAARSSVPTSAPRTRTLLDTPSARRRSRRSWTRWLAIAVLIGGTGGAIAWGLRGSPSTGHTPHGLTMLADATPVDAPPGAGPLDAPAPVVDAVPPPDAAPRRRDPAPAPAPARRPRKTEVGTIKPVLAAEGEGRLTVTSEPWGAVYVDGKRVAAETPAYQIRVLAGVHQVKVFYPDTGRYSASRTVTVRAGEPVAIGFRH